MKQFFTLLSLIGFTAAFGQYGDTLGVSIGTYPQFAPNNQATIIPFTGGYVYGTNSDANDFKAIAQGYQLDEPSQVAGVLSFIAAKGQNVGGTPSSLTFELYQMTATGAKKITSPNPFETVDVEGPGSTVLSSASIFFEEIDTTQLTYTWVEFSAPVNVTGNIAIAANLVSMKTAGDTIGFLSDGIGAANGADYAFHKATLGVSDTWFTSNSLFGGALDNNIAIFPVLTSEAGITRINGISTNVYPNPAADLLKISLSSTSSGTYSFKLVDIKGIETGVSRDVQAGTNGLNTELNIEKVAAGNYFLVISGPQGFKMARQVLIRRD
ncbi:MAG: T9SS type A sorting domain-containing protein [Bacteroidia bacterium]